MRVRRRLLLHDRTWPVLIGAAIAVVVLVPLLLAGLNGLSRTWYPAGDWGVMELRVHDIGSVHTPLVGPYSRYAWNHPGPLLFWLLAVPYRLTGGRPSALLLGAALLNALAIAGMLAFAWRRGRLAFLLPMAVCLTLLAHTLGPALLRDPWNAWVTVIPFGLLVVAAWAATEGDRAALPVVAVVGAFEAQSHIGFLPLAVVLTAAAGIGFYLRTRRARPVLVGAGVAALCWLPLVFDAATGGTNVADIVSFFGTTQEVAGWGTALRVTALELGLPAPWLGTTELVNPAGGGLMGRSAGALLWPIVIFVAAGAVAWWAEARAAVRFQLFLLATVVVGMLSLSRMTGGVFDYLVRWWWTLAALGAAAVGWSLLCGARRLLGEHRQALVVGRVAALGLAGLLVLNASVETAGAVDQRLPVDDWYPALDAVAGPTAHAVPTDEPVYLQTDGPLSGWVGDAMAPRLVAVGVDVRVPDAGIDANKFGDLRIVDLDGATSRTSTGDTDQRATSVPAAGAASGSSTAMRGLWVVTGSRIDAFRAAGTGTQLAAYDPLTPAERLESDQIEQRLRDAYATAGRDDLVAQLDAGVSLWTDEPVPGVDPDQLTRYEDLRSRGVPVATFLVEDPTTPAPARPVAGPTAGWTPRGEPPLSIASRP